MAMIKSGQAFDQAVVDVINPTTSDVSCEKCSQPLDLMSSTNGIVKCQKCGFDNPVKDIN